MPYLQIRDAGKFGRITDVTETELPPQAYTDLLNVQTQDNAIVRAAGEEAEALGTPVITPYYAFPAPDSGNLFWVYTDLQKVYATDGVTHSNITRQDGVPADVNYTGTLSDKWTNTWLAGALVLNNGVDLPQAWIPLGLGQRLQNLPNWPTSYRAKFIRGFKNFLIAGNISNGPEVLPTVVKWSDPADPGTVPGSWDHTSTTTLAGEQPLSNTPGDLVDAAPLRQSMILYKQDSIIAMTLVGGRQVFRFDDISTRTGLMSANCVKEYKPGMQVALTREGDVVSVTTSGVQSVIEGKNRRELQSLLEVGTRENAFLAVNYPKKLVYVFIPDGETGLCNRLFIWNTVNNTWVRKETSETIFATEGPLDPTQTTDTWESQTDTWDTVSRNWNEQLFDVNRIRLLGAYPNENDVRIIESSTQRGGVSFSSTIERAALGVVGSQPDGTLRVNYQRKKLITEVWPQITAENQMNVQVYLGDQQKLKGPIKWYGPYNFDPTTQDKVDVLLESRYPSIRFVIDAEADWKYEGYGLLINEAGVHF
jgi:hypothetical protein